MHKKWIKPKNNLAIEIQDLSKTYTNSQKKIHALSNINLNIVFMVYLVLMELENQL